LVRSEAATAAAREALDVAERARRTAEERCAGVLLRGMSERERRSEREKS